MMRVAMLPRSPWWRDNPYLDLLETALKAHGVQIVDDPNDRLGGRWLWRHRGEVDVLHLHWLDHQYHRPTRLGSLWALLYFLAKLGGSRILGYRLVWTAHNLEPHEGADRRLDRLCWLAVYRLAHRVVCHSEDTRRQLAHLFGERRGVAVIPHPSYVNAYAAAPSKEDARRRLGLEGADRVFLCFGQVRPYKGFQDAILAFRQMPGRHLKLVIAGRPADSAIAAEIRTLADGDERIRTRMQFVPDDDVPAYFSAADAVLLPFRKIATSGSAILAMSQARAVIAPAMGSLPELITNGNGLLYEPGQPGGLLSAMQRALELDLNAMGRRAYEGVQAHSPHDVARRHFELYASICSHGEATEERCRKSA